MTIAQGMESGAPKGGMGGGVVPGLFPAPESLRPTLTGDRWAVVAGHPLVSQVAAEVLAAGGNAVDAGVAAGLATNVVQADMANFGGIAPILVRRPDGAVASVAGVGRWGREATLEAVRHRFGGSLPLGGAPCIVPGAPSAWITALREFGTWSFAQVAAPAIALAADGFLLDHRTATNLRIMGAGFTRWEQNAAIYWPHGRPPEAGDRLRQPDLARLLGDLAAAEHGDRVDGLQAVHDAFYRGEPARLIVEDVRARGGFLTLQDLHGFAAEVGTAPAVDFAGRRVFVTPTWSQGLIVAQALKVMEQLDPQRLGHNTGGYLHALAESFKVTFADRERHYADPETAEVGATELLAPAHLRELRDRVGERAAPAGQHARQAGPVLGSTTSIVVADGTGLVFNSSPSDTIDGGPIIAGLGIMCSPRGVQSRLVDGHPNAVAPGRRPCITPGVAIAVGGNHPDDFLAVACPGGDVIVEAITQAILNVDVFGMLPQQATEAPRVAAFSFPSAFHPHPAVEDVVFVEDRIPAEVRRDLAERGHEVTTWPAYEFDAGSVQIVQGRRHGEELVLTAGADPRRTAYAIAR